MKWWSADLATKRKQGRRINKAKRSEWVHLGGGVSQRSDIISRRPSGSPRKLSVVKCNSSLVAAPRLKRIVAQNLITPIGTLQIIRGGDGY